MKNEQPDCRPPSASPALPSDSRNLALRLLAEARRDAEALVNYTTTEPDTRLAEHLGRTVGVLVSLCDVLEKLIEVDR